MSTDGHQATPHRPNPQFGHTGSRTASRPPTTRVSKVTDDTGELQVREPTGSAPPRVKPPVRESVRGPVRKEESTTSETKTGSAPRRVRLAVSRVDPWSVMKLSFLMSVGVGIMMVVAAIVVWFTLDGLHVFTQVNNFITEVTSDPEFFNVLDYVGFDRVVSLATMIAVVDIVLLTALATIGAFLYNIVAALVGGVHVTLTDD